MTTREFDEPVLVQYRDASTWRRVLALAVRRQAPHRYEVLIMQVHRPDAQTKTWVPRSRIRAEDEVMVSGTAPA